MADVTEAVREVPAETSPDFELLAWSVARRAFSAFSASCRSFSLRVGSEPRRAFARYPCGAVGSGASSAIEPRATRAWGGGEGGR